MLNSKIYKNKSGISQDQIGILTIIVKKLIMIFAIILPLYVYILLSNMTNDNQDQVFHLIKELGEWAINALFVVVFSGPLYKIFADNKNIIKFKIDNILKFFLNIRPEMGFFMGALAISHGVFIVLSRIKANLWQLPLDFSLPSVWGIWAGVIAFIITIPMFVTSNRWAIEKLGPIWFKIHSLIIYVVIFGVLHAQLIKAKNNGIQELIVFVIVIVVYFVVRYIANNKENKINNK